MSVQTGVETPRGPASRQIRDRVRYRWERWKTEPNPLWMREMRQSARLVRTPVILMVLTILTTMLLAFLGGIMTGTLSPAEAGTVLFHVFFSIAFFVVTLVGPALAANSVASEREGHTWEAVLLTGMRPSEIASGKFWSAYTAIGMYIVMLGPVGALPFLFGGVTTLEVLVAFAFLFLLASLGVAFGLAISSKMQSLRVALLVTLLLAVPLALMIFLWLGVGLSVAVAELWPNMTRGAPVWLPTAYARAPFGLEYVVYLVALPLLAIALPAWFLYEVTHANLTSVTDDRSYGLKRWFVATSLLLGLAATVPTFASSGNDMSGFAIAGIGAYATYAVFCAFLFAGEPIGPSRRVKAMLATAGRLRRGLRPGVVPTTWLELAIGLLCVGGLTAAALVNLQVARAPRIAIQGTQILLFGISAAGFLVLVIGLASFLRARATSTAVPRVLLLVILFVLVTLPWIAAAITGALARGSGSSDTALALASPSPFYVFVAIEAASRPGDGPAAVLTVAWAVIYAAVGMSLFVAGARRCGRIIRKHEEVLAEADERLAEEDRARAEARARAAEQSRHLLGAVPAPHDDEGNAPGAQGSDAGEPIDAGSPDTRPSPAPAAVETDGDGRAATTADEPAAGSPAAEDSAPPSHGREPAARSPDEHAEGAADDEAVPEADVPPDPGDRGGAPPPL